MLKHNFKVRSWYNAKQTQVLQRAIPFPILGERRGKFCRPLPTYFHFFTGPSKLFFLLRPPPHTYYISFWGTPLPTCFIFFSIPLPTHFYFWFHLRPLRISNEIALCGPAAISKKIVWCMTPKLSQNKRT